MRTAAEIKSFIARFRHANACKIGKSVDDSRPHERKVRTRIPMEAGIMILFVRAVAESFSVLRLRSWISKQLVGRGIFSPLRIPPTMAAAFPTAKLQKSQIPATMDSKNSRDGSCISPNFSTVDHTRGRHGLLFERFAFAGQDCALQSPVHERIHRVQYSSMKYIDKDVILF
jgi:hypothetical protein